MNPYEPRVTLVHRPAARAVDIYVSKPSHQPGRHEALRMDDVDNPLGPLYVWHTVNDGVEYDPFVSLPEEVYDALRTTLVGDKLEEREFLRGRLQELERALAIEQARVDRVLP